MILQKIAKRIMKSWGWTHEGSLPETPKFIVVNAPHTSMWDFVIGIMFYLAHDIRSKIMIKKEMFFWPLGGLLLKLGAFPVDRSKGGTKAIKYIVEEFEKNESFILTITPEGTRKAVKHWKKGFYSVAYLAKVPMVPTYFDYKRKVIGIGQSFMASGDYEADLRRIQQFVKQATPKHPEQFILPNNL